MENVIIVYVSILYSLVVFGNSYHSNYSLYEVTAYNDRDRVLLYNLHFKEQAIVFYNLVTNQAALSMKVLVKNSHINSFTEKMENTNIQCIYESEYLYKYETLKQIRYTPDPEKNFLTYDDIYEWADKKLEAYPNFMIKRTISTRTFENRDILAIKMFPKKAPLKVFVVGGDNARDWMATAVIINYMDRMAAKYDFIYNNPPKDTESARIPDSLFDFYEMYFVPVINPDGYVHAMEVNNKFWMKNMQKFYPKKICHNGRDAIGVNIDRNWHLEKNIAPESECNGIFVGHTALSERENSGLFKFLNKNAPKMIAFIHIKNVGRIITIPYANSERSVNHDTMMEILPSVSNTMQAEYNETYYYGTTSTFLFNYSGNMADYVKKKLNIPMVFTVNLQHGDNFLPTPQDIPVLTDHLTTILNETLMLAKDIYGPLLNSHIKTFDRNLNSILTVIILFHVIYCATLL